MDQLTTPPVNRILPTKGRDTARAPRKRQLLFDIAADDTQSNSSLPGNVTPVQQHQPQSSPQPAAVAFATKPSGTPTSRPTIEADLASIGSSNETPGRVVEQDCDDPSNKGSHKEQAGVDISVSRRLHFGSQMSHMVTDNSNNAVNLVEGLQCNSRGTAAPDIANVDAQSELPADVDRSSSQARFPASNEEAKPRQEGTRTHTADRAVTRFPASSNADGDEMFRWSRVHRGRVLPTMHQPEVTAHGGNAVGGKRMASDRDWSSPDRLRRRPAAYYTSHHEPAGASRATASKMTDAVHEDGSGVGSSALTRSRLGAMTRGEQLVALAGGTLSLLAHKEEKAGKSVQDEAEAAGNGLTMKGFRTNPQEAEMDKVGRKEAAEGTAWQSAGSTTKLPAEYEELHSLYSALELCCSLLHSRRLLCTFEAVKASVEDMTKRRFSKHHLAKILHVAQLSTSLASTDPAGGNQAQLMRLEAIRRVEKSTSPVKHSTASAAAAARFGHNATDLRIIFPPPPQAPSTAAVASNGDDCSGISPPGQAEEAVALGGSDGKAGRECGKAAEAGPSGGSDAGRGRAGVSSGEGCMLWRTQEFRRRLMKLASLPQPPVRIPEATLPSPSIPHVSTTPLAPPSIPPSRSVRSLSPRHSHKPAASQRFGRHANPDFGNACRADLRAELERAVEPAVEASKKENAAAGTSSKVVSGERGTVCASPLHEAVPVVPAARGMVPAAAAAVGGGTEAGKEKAVAGRQGARKALFADAGRQSSNEQLTGLDARADASEQARKEMGLGEEAAEAGCTATWTGQAEEGQGRSHEGGSERCDVSNGVGERTAGGSCMDVLERVREKKKVTRDDDAGSTSDDDILNSLPQDLVQLVQQREAQLRIEESVEAKKERKRRMRLGQLPLLMEMLVSLFAATRTSVLPHKDLVTRLVATHCKETNQIEIEEQLSLLAELAPDWLLVKVSVKGDKLYRISKTVSIANVRGRIFQ